MKLTWVDVNGFDGEYKVSNFGSVFSVKRGIMLKPSIDRYGYEKVVLYKNGKPHFFTVHRLVAIHFIPNPFNKKEVNHINGVRINNHVCNLEWVTQKENLDHSFEYGKQIQKKQKVIAINLETKEHFYFNSQREASRELKISQAHIQRVLKGVYKQASGFTFIRNEG